MRIGLLQAWNEDVLERMSITGGVEGYLIFQRRYRRSNGRKEMDYGLAGTSLQHVIAPEQPVPSMSLHVERG